MSSGPLTGVRIIALTHAWSGTYATELLGFLGADVIQVEARRRPDNWRGGYEGPIPQGVFDRNRMQQPWNVSGLYNAVNLNKRAITLDLADPRGRQLFRRLVPLADVVADNFAPRVVANWGLDYKTLMQLKPDIIQASLSAYGATGPYRNIPGIGGTVEPMSGMSSLLGYEGGNPLNSGAMYPDPVAGLYFAAAILVALRHREETGEGQYIDLGMMEANATFIGDAFAEFKVTGAVRPRLGNRDRTIAPHNIYQTADGAWLALSAETAAQWIGLRSLLKAPELMDDSLLKVWGRKEREEEIDGAIAAWLAQETAVRAERSLRGRGVPAARVLSPIEVLDHPHLRERGIIISVDHPQAGRHRMLGVPWHLSLTPAAVTRPAPTLGQHSFEVLSELLGVSRQEYQDLVELNVTGDSPPQ